VSSVWELIRAVTGIEVVPDSPPAEQARASEAFVRAWNYDFVWNVLIHGEQFGNLRTDMGHAEYAAGGADRRDTVHCPFSEPEEVLALDPVEAYGRPDHAQLVAAFEADYRRQRQRFPTAVTMTGVYITCISGLIEIFGWEMMLLGLGTDPDRFGALTGRYAEWIQPYFDALAEADVPMVMVHDDIVWTSGPFVAPDWYRRYVFPHYHQFLRPLRDAGKRIAFTSDGDYTMFIDDIAAAGVHGFVMEPTTDMAYVAERYGRTHFFIGNVDTRVLLRGTKEQIRAEVERCMEIGKPYPGFFLAVGNHIPANTPVDAAMYYNEVYEELSRR